jgi:hypothetical protein
MGPDQVVKPCRPPSAATSPAPGLEHEVVGVAEHDPDAEVLEVVGGEHPHGPAGAHRHEARGGDVAARRGEDPGARRAAAGLDPEVQPHGPSPRAPTSHVASPKDRNR